MLNVTFKRFGEVEKNNGAPVETALQKMSNDDDDDSFSNMEISFIVILVLCAIIIVTALLYKLVGYVSLTVFIL